MGCGNPVEVFNEDPKHMAGQGLAQADQYDASAASAEYQQLMGLATNSGTQQSVLDLEQRFKPQYTAQDLARMNQGYTGIRSMLRESDPNAAAVSDRLIQQALQDVSAGSNLTPQQQRAVQQNSRAAMAARGMGGSNASLADELLKQFDLGEQLKQQRQAYAMNALGLAQNLYQNPALNYGRVSASASPTLVSPQDSINFLRSIYGENQANNRQTAELETKIGMHQADVWNDWAKTMTGASMGGGGGGGMGGMGGK